MSLKKGSAFETADFASLISAVGSFKSDANPGSECSYYFLSKVCNNAKDVAGFNLLHKLFSGCSISLECGSDVAGNIGCDFENSIRSN